MATVNGGNLKKGLYILFKNEPYQVIGTQFVSPGKGSAFTRAKLRGVKNGNTLEFTFKSTENLEILDVGSRELTFSYIDGEEVSFMDMRTYEQFNIKKDLIADKIGLLVPDLNVYVIFFNDEAIGVNFPPKVKMKVTVAEDAARGDRQTAGKKPVTMETGLVVQAPLFIKPGDTLIIDTETNAYVSRG
ncbi:MAG: elongation factor P [Pseudomonadales bacterium]|jgi:elongation factor P|nr:elongation factor P [Pseudomonadales bacterium]